MAHDGYTVIIYYFSQIKTFISHFLNKFTHNKHLNLVVSSWKENNGRIQPHGFLQYDSMKYNSIFILYALPAFILCIIYFLRKFKQFSHVPAFWVSQLFVGPGDVRVAVDASNAMWRRASQPRGNQDYHCSVLSGPIADLKPVLVTLRMRQLGTRTSDSTTSYRKIATERIKKTSNLVKRKQQLFSLKRSKMYKQWEPSLNIDADTGTLKMNNLSKVSLLKYILN